MLTLPFLTGLSIGIVLCGIVALFIIKNLQKKVSNLQMKHARLDEQKQSLNQQLEERQNQEEAFQKRTEQAFQNLAQKILEQNSEKFSSQNKEQLQTVLKPIKEKMQEFENKVQETFEKNTRDASALREQIKSLKDMSEKMGHEAQELTKALKGDHKMQGNWGELILKRVLELSGLQEGIEYYFQARGMGLKNEEGQHQYPDVVVNLPEDKHLVIDSKVSLKAYEQSVNTATQQEADQHLQEHLTAVKNHVKNLSEQHYHSLDGLNSPEFVLLFIPVEGSFSTLMRAGENLFDYAWQRKIVLVSPSTLLATLKTVSSIWKYEYQHKNAQEIAKIGGSMYDQLVGFVEEMHKVDRNMDQAKNAYDNAMKRLYTGQQSVTNKAQKLKNLGIKSNKELPED